MSSKEQPKDSQLQGAGLVALGMLVLEVEVVLDVEVVLVVVVGHTTASVSVNRFNEYRQHDSVSLITCWKAGHLRTLRACYSSNMLRR